MVHEVIIGGIPSAKVGECWDAVRPLLEPSLDPQEYQAEDVLAALEARDMQLWVAWDAYGRARCAMTTRIQIYAKSKICVLVHCGGEWDACMKQFLDETLFPWAKESGASSVRIQGRRGWEKRLKDYFEPIATILERRL
jgi:hypothetical protein